MGTVQLVVAVPAVPDAVAPLPGGDALTALAGELLRLPAHGAVSLVRRVHAVEATVADPALVDAGAVAALELARVAP